MERMYGRGNHNNDKEDKIEEESCGIKNFICPMMKYMCPVMMNPRMGAMMQQNMPGVMMGGMAQNSMYGMKMKTVEMSEIED